MLKPLEHIGNSRAYDSPKHHPTSLAIDAVGMGQERRFLAGALVCSKPEEVPGREFGVCGFGCLEGGGPSRGLETRKAIVCRAQFRVCGSGFLSP